MPRPRSLVPAASSLPAAVETVAAVDLLAAGAALALGDEEAAAGFVFAAPLAGGPGVLVWVTGARRQTPIGPGGRPVG